MKKPIFLISLLVIVVVVLVLARITLENTISTTGITLVNMQNEIAVVSKENELLKEQYLSEASYTTVAQKATKLGYVQFKSEVDLNTPLPLAYSNR